nr:uncharacterized protein LOC113397791 [Vanessa tameamea]
MKTYLFITLLIAVQLATATLTLDKITEKVHAGLKVLKEKAVTKLHKLKQEIDLKKLHQLDVLHLLPYAHKHYVHEHYSKKTPLVVDPHQIERLKHYFEPHHKPAPLHHAYHHFEHFEHI